MSQQEIDELHRQVDALHAEDFRLVRVLHAFIDHLAGLGSVQPAKEETAPKLKAVTKGGE